MARVTTPVTVGTTATKLNVAPDNDNTAGQTVNYYNAGTVDVSLGDASVTAGNGILLAPGGTATEQLPPGANTYGVVASGTCKVIVDQVGV